MNQQPFIVCENLVKIYKVAEIEVVALRGLDLSVGQGELLGVVGPSGSGKSSLLNILGGLDRPSAGQARVGGSDLMKMSSAALDRYRREQVGFVWQQSARNLIPFLNALENVELPMALSGRAGPGQRRRRAEELLQLVGLAERRDHRLHQLSGGEQQRVAMAVALANSPSLLLADEPTGEVDSATAETIFKAIEDLHDAYGLATVIVSHDPRLAHYVHRVVSIRDGQTATETIRTSAAGAPPALAAGPVADAFQELAVLDSAGRLHIPEPFLERFNIRGRARLEMTDEGILIRPAPAASGPPTEPAPAVNGPSEPERRGLLGRLARLWQDGRRRRRR